MRSKTSCFNPSVFLKNLTRFAPVWGLYTLCLVLGLLLIYSNGGTAKQYHFAANLTELIQIMGLINLVYGALAAQLLFGDLYNTRMCYALHAMPLRRETLFLTNVLSGLAFSAVPTLLMALLCLPLLANSVFEGAMLLPVYVFAGSNMQYLCFFGIAVFCCLCVGSRLTMVVVYGLINFGAAIAYWLVDTVYTPLLYGVVTPSHLAEMLTPVSQFTSRPYIETDALYKLLKLVNDDITKVTATYSLTDRWSILFIWAGVGAAFLVLALLLYRKRDLECAGDAMAFRAMEPVFQVLVALVTAAAAQFFISEFLGFYGQYHYVFLLTGLAVGWFAGRMLIDRSTRVFRLKNWYGLGALTAALALTLGATQLDILGIETWMPNAEDVSSVSVSYSYTLTDQEDIQKILTVHEEALQTRLEDSGAYVQDEAGEWVRFMGVESVEEIEKWQDLDCRYAYSANIVYTLKNGKEVARRFPVWSDGRAGDAARAVFTRWEFVGIQNNTVYVDGEETTVPVLEHVLNSLQEMTVEGLELPVKDIDRETAQGLIDAVKADCEAGTMTQIRYLQSGHFRRPSPEKDGSHYYRPYLYVGLNGSEYSWGIDVYPGCTNTLNWLREQGLLTYDTVENNLCIY